MEVKDYLLDANDDLQIGDNGDFLSGESTYSNQRELLLLSKGEFKAEPLCGVGLNEFLLDDGSKAEFERIVNQQFKADGMRIQKVDLKSWEDLKIKASYEETVSPR
jgi:hypothetical protein